MSLPPSYNLLKEYPNRVYVETGIWRGDSLQQAIDAGFSIVIGIDNDIECLEFCKNRFAMKRWHEGNSASLYFYSEKNIELSQDIQFIRVSEGDSATYLWEVIKGQHYQITFFLDSHWQMLEGTEPGPNPFPLLKELEQIGRHHIKTHTIIIDDYHIFYPDRVGYSKDDVKEAILKINPAYKFTHVANPVIDGILIASI
jgi:hypothetical protein